MNFTKVLNVALILPITLSSLSFAKNYKGAEIYTNVEYTYGKWEMRMRAAKASGTLSTFFLYKNGSEKGIDPWEEIDIEIKGKDSAQTVQTNIITGLNGNVKSEELHNPYAFGDKFYTFTLEWTPGKVVWKIDGATVRTTEGGQADSLKSSMGTRFNLWSSTSTGWVGSFDPAILPVYQYVNWVQYSEYTPGTGDNGSDFTLLWRDDFDTLDQGRWSFANWTFNGNRVDFSPDNINVRDGMLILGLTTADQEGQIPSPVPTDGEVSAVTQQQIWGMRSIKSTVSADGGVKYHRDETLSTDLIGRMK